MNRYEVDEKLMDDMHLSLDRQASVASLQRKEPDVQVNESRSKCVRSVVEWYMTLESNRNVLHVNITIQYMVEEPD